MLGIAGFFYTNEAIKDPDALLMAMMLAHSDEHTIGDAKSVQRKVLSGQGAIGQVGNAGQEIISSPECSLFIHGDLYGPTPKELLERYQQYGIEFLDASQVDGSFVGVLIDSQRKRVFLFTDPFGLEPMYWYRDDNFIAFGTTIKNLLVLPRLDKKVDLATLASFWNFGFAFLNHTPFSQIRLLSPGTAYLIDFQELHCQKHVYANLIGLFGKPLKTVNDGLERVSYHFHDAVRKRSNDMNSLRLGLSLSGGLDSRAILGGLGKERGEKLTTYTLGLPGCADERLAARMAEVYGCHHSFIPIDETALRDFEELAKMMVTLSDGMYHPHESTERVALEYLDTNPFDVMLRGHGGEIAKVALAYPVMATREMQEMSPTDVIDYLFDRAALAGQGIDMQTLLSPDIYSQVDGTAREMFGKAAEPALQAGIGKSDLCVYLYIDQWIRRQVVASLSLFRSRVGIRLPYLDRSFLQDLLRLPVDRRWNGEFHKYFIRHYAPELEKIPDSNTGAPLDAGRLRLIITDKINAVLKRLGITGFRHYTEFQVWQRKYFNQAIESILFSDKCLDRGYYRPEGLRDVYERHVSGQKNHGHFLGTAVAIELWHRTYID